MLAIMDTIIAYMVKLKHPFFNETNPIYLLTGSFLIAIIVKFIVIGGILYFFWKIYVKSPIYARFLSIVYLVILIFSHIQGVSNNAAEYKKIPIEVKEVPKEVKQEYYGQTYYKSPEMSIFLFILNILIYFSVWWTVDNEYFEYKLIEIK